MFCNAAEDGNLAWQSCAGDNMGVIILTAPTALLHEFTENHLLHWESMCLRHHVQTGGELQETATSFSSLRTILRRCGIHIGTSKRRVQVFEVRHRQYEIAEVID